MQVLDQSKVLKLRENFENSFSTVRIVIYGQKYNFNERNFTTYHGKKSRGVEIDLDSSFFNDETVDE